MHEVSHLLSTQRHKIGDVDVVRHHGAMLVASWEQQHARSAPDVKHEPRLKLGDGEASIHAAAGPGYGLSDTLSGIVVGIHPKPAENPTQVEGIMSWGTSRNRREHVSIASRRRYMDGQTNFSMACMLM